MTYDFLLESVWHPPLLFAGEHSTVLPSREELKVLWHSGGLGRELRTSDGRRIQLEHPGEWNRLEGPDFLGARLRLDGHPLEGGIVVDEWAADWDQHNGAGDPAHEGAILQLAYRAGPPAVIARTPDGREVPHVLVCERDLADRMNRPQREVAIANPGRCAHPLRRMPKGALERLLQEAAEHRSGRLAAAWTHCIEWRGRDQALFEATAEALGHCDNQLSMRRLAQRLPVARLLGDPHGPGSAEALLFGVAGFLTPYIEELVRPESRDILRSLWTHWGREREHAELAPARSLHWKTGDQRPANHPQRRIGALATLLHHWDAFRELAYADPFEFKPLADLLGSLGHPFWSSHHRFSAPSADEPYTLFARARAVDLAARFLVPLALAEGRFSWHEYRKLRHSETAPDVRAVARHLMGDPDKQRDWTRRVLHQQGLLQVDQDFRLDNISDGQEGPYAEQLQQWR